MCWWWPAPAPWAWPPPPRCWLPPRQVRPGCRQPLCPACPGTCLARVREPARIPGTLFPNAAWPSGCLSALRRRQARAAAARRRRDRGPGRGGHAGAGQDGDADGWASAPRPGASHASRRAGLASPSRQSTRLQAHAGERLQACLAGASPLAPRPSAATCRGPAAAGVGAGPARVQRRRSAGAGGGCRAQHAAPAGRCAGGRGRAQRWARPR